MGRAKQKRAFGHNADSEMPEWDFGHARDESESVHSAHVRKHLSLGVAQINHILTSAVLL